MLSEPVDPWSRSLLESYSPETLYLLCLAEFSLEFSCVSIVNLIWPPVATIVLTLVVSTSRRHTESVIKVVQKSFTCI